MNQIIENSALSCRESESTILAKSLEREAIVACEKGDIDTALDIFRKAIEADVSRASCYNNRAQAFRLVNLS